MYSPRDDKYQYGLSNTLPGGRTRGIHDSKHSFNNMNRANLIKRMTATAYSMTKNRRQDQHLKKFDDAHNALIEEGRRNEAYMQQARQHHLMQTRNYRLNMLQTAKQFKNEWDLEHKKRWRLNQKRTAERLKMEARFQDSLVVSKHMVRAYCLVLQACSSTAVPFAVYLSIDVLIHETLLSFAMLL